MTPFRVLMLMCGIGITMISSCWRSAQTQRINVHEQPVYDMSGAIVVDNQTFPITCTTAHQPERALFFNHHLNGRALGYRCAYEQPSVWHWYLCSDTSATAHIETFPMMRRDGRLQGTAAEIWCRRGSTAN